MLKNLYFSAFFLVFLFAIGPLAQAQKAGLVSDFEIVES